jgi:hypothetical protein
MPNGRLWKKQRKKIVGRGHFRQVFLQIHFPSTGPVQAIELAQIFGPAACQLFLHSNDVFGATLHFRFGLRG